jgi:hypothetical protein
MRLPVQTNSAGTYIDSTGAGAVRPGLGSLNTDHEYWMVGDWKDGTPGGGNIAAQLITVVSVDPVGSALSGSGSLYLNSSGDIKNTLQEALDHNLGVTFSLTGNGESFSVSSLSFWLARDDNSNFRTWENWYLLASADAAFTADEVVASGTTQTSAYETWTKQTAVLDMRLPDGATRNFLLIGTCSSTEPWGRETAISDVTVEGRIYIAPGTRIIVR